VFTIAQSYLHSLDPTALQFSDSFGIKWYGLSYLTGFVVGWLILRWLASTGRILLSAAQVTDFITYTVGGVLVGGRLGYCFFYDPALLIDFSGSFPFWGALAIHEGGMASHGGILGVILAMCLFARNRNIPVLHLIDITAFIAPPGLFFGRLANFVNGELWGKPMSGAFQENPPWWSVKYPEEVHTLPIENINALVPHLGNPLATDLPQQVVIETYGGNQLLADHLEPLLSARWPSQIFQALSDGPILLLVLVVIWLVPRKPGVIAGSFLIAYGILRIITELFREPDLGVSLTLGLSRGQVLSVLMLLAGAALILVSTQISAQRVGGLLKKNTSERTPGPDIENA
jgi:phosphatidylglycerol:prolipoprotein diacylglycerol transferase